MQDRMTSAAKLTYEDFLKIPDDGRRHEIIDGEHIVSPSPSWQHQRVVGRIFGDLLGLESTLDAIVFVAPLDVHLGRHDILEPDVLALARRNRNLLSERKVDGPPDLVVEVISPSTRHMDFGRKRATYAKFGVREYWIVDLDGREVTVNLLEGDAYVTHVHCEVPVTCTVFPAYTFDWPALLASLDAM